MAFGYLARRYNLTFVTPYKGFSPSAEPASRRVPEMIETFKRSGGKALFYEAMSQPRLAGIVAEGTGADLLPLNPGGTVSAEAFARGVTFVELMETNLENLKIGLGCK
jgi:zinc transport system substrate-binding protein